MRGMFSGRRCWMENEWYKQEKACCRQAFSIRSVQFQIAVLDPAKLALDLAEEDAEHGGQDEGHPAEDNA